MGVTSIMGFLARFGHPLVSFGGLALVGTTLMTGYFTQSSETCGSDEPTTCSYFESAPEDKILEKRGDDFMRKTKAYTNSDVKDHRPEYSYNYSACSGITGTGLMHAGTPVTNSWCQALGCNYKQCVKFRVKCNQDTGLLDNDYIKNGALAPDIYCVAAKLNSNISPGNFTAVFLCFIISITMCVIGCIGGGGRAD